ncbi:hypothetical protein CWE12_02430 [Aliidiomarina sedimenti]|uniref:Lipoprotein n=1 Tax=Aliidiomarina sedimenti TaxID=1933879 RepID=A0ABY0C2K1_9GAMM|nr:hypothetical protein [Aliidiomarina sedimenti]RUO31873.1 hypothetical protein CWE12_02430 [Aliidiomarina sedimenti]
MKNNKMLLLIGALVVLTACSSIPLGTMIKMVRLNPLDMDPQQLVVAVKTPEGLKVREGDVVIDFSFRTDDPDVSFDHQFPVVINDDYAVPESLTKDLDDDESITVMQLSEDDALTMYNAQQAVKEYRRNHEGGAGNIDLRLVSACRDENFSWSDSKLNVYLKTTDDESFFLFLRNMDVTELDDDIQRDLNALSSCA